jgi:hypothetical protein
MSKLLLTVTASRLLSNEWRPTVLNIWDDKIVVENRGLISKVEAVINYHQVAQVVHRRGIIQSTLEIVNTGGAENIVIEHLSVELAEKAKNLIEQKVNEIHSGKAAPAETTSSLDELPKLAELKEKGIITEEEFQQKKKQILGL